MGCKAKIRPFPDDTELECERDEIGHIDHEAVLRDFAYPGSETRFSWLEDDRRTFRGDWPGTCTPPECPLPAGHPRGCA